MRKGLVTNDEARRRRAQSRRDKIVATRAKKWYVDAADVAAGPVTVGKLSSGSGERQKKWFLGLENASAGPVSIGKLGIGSGKRGARGTRSEMVGVAPRSRNIQVTMPRIVTEMGGRYGATDVLKGTELLADISTGATGALKGDILTRILLNPSNFPKTRLAQFAPLYQRYRFRRLSFFYEPIANATQSGQLIGFGDYDVDNIINTDSTDNINVAAAHLGQRICQIWEDQVFPFGVVDDFTSLFTSLTEAEARLIYQGVFYLMAASTLPPNSSLGNLYIAYEVELNIPQLSPGDIQQQFSLLIEAPGSATAGVPLWSGAPAQQAEIPNNIIWNVTTLTVPACNQVTLSGLGLGTYLLIFNGFTTPASTTWGVDAFDFVGATGWNSPYPVGMASVVGNPSPPGVTSACLGYLEVTSSSVAFKLRTLASPIPPSGFPTAVQMVVVSVGSTSLAKAPCKHVPPIFMDHGRIIADPGERELESWEVTAMVQRAEEKDDAAQRALRAELEEVRLQLASAVEQLDANPDSPAAKHYFRTSSGRHISGRV